jgi:hypothetical protein
VLSIRVLCLIEAWNYVALINHEGTAAHDQARKRSICRRICYPLFMKKTGVGFAIRKLIGENMDGGEKSTNKLLEKE